MDSTRILFYFIIALKKSSLGYYKKFNLRCSYTCLSPFHILSLQSSWRDIFPYFVYLILFSKDIGWRYWAILHYSYSTEKYMLMLGRKIEPSGIKKVIERPVSLFHTVLQWDKSKEEQITFPKGEHLTFADMQYNFNGNTFCHNTWQNMSLIWWKIGPFSLLCYFLLSSSIVKECKVLSNTGLCIFIFFFKEKKKCGLGF